MYSVVLMAALATGSNAPAGHWNCGCHGSYSCFGTYGSCYGCYGGTYSCYGGCYGGCTGCYGGGCWGCYGGSFGSCYGCHGCYGCYGCYGSGYATGYTPAHVQPAMPGAPGAAPEKVPAPKPEEKKVSAANAAKLIIDLPADAKLFVDDQLMKTTSAHRVFNTPTLESGQTYFYILRAEVVRDGKSQSESKRVIVRAGEEIRAAFPELDAISTVKAEVNGER
jgi:uncharacterized protein (TIGR03000 family)